MGLLFWHLTRELSYDDLYTVLGAAASPAERKLGPATPVPGQEYLGSNVQGS
jgi:hypothetical protein